MNCFVCSLIRTLCFSKVNFVKNVLTINYRFKTIVIVHYAVCTKEICV